MLFFAGCTDGDIRLTGGSSLWEGRVEICQSNSYLRVCDDLWDELEASVVCRQLNYTGQGCDGYYSAVLKLKQYFCISDVVPLKRSTFVSQDSLPAGIYNKALLCDGDENTLLDCRVYGGESVGEQRCPDDNSEDAGVKCNGI